MENQLKDKVAIITGASSGIGEGTAILFAKRGASVALCGRNVDNLHQVMEQCQQESTNPIARFITIPGDITDQEVRAKIVEDTVKYFGHVDCLVHCAGVATATDKLASLTVDDFDLVMNTNAKAVFFLIQKAIPELEKTKGSVVVLSSIVSTVPNPSLLTYSLAKAAVDHLIRMLAANLGPKGIRFNLVRPSFVVTNMLRAFSKETATIADINKMMEEKVGKDHPLEQRVGTVEENAKVIAFLSSDEASYVTGVDLKTDGASSLKTCYM